MTTGLVRNGLLFDAVDGRWLGALDANGKEQFLPAVPGVFAAPIVPFNNSGGIELP